MPKKRLMILGAGPFQVYGIQRAVELGYHVITVDYLPDNFGHAFSHGYVNASTTDIEAVIEAAKRERIDGIATFSSGRGDADGRGGRQGTRSAGCQAFGRRADGRQGSIPGAAA